MRASHSTRSLFSVLFVCHFLRLVWLWSCRIGVFSGAHVLFLVLLHRLCISLRLCCLWRSGRCTKEGADLAGFALCPVCASLVVRFGGLCGRLRGFTRRKVAYEKRYVSAGALSRA